MKIRAVTANNRQKAFVVVARGKTYRLPYAKVDPRPGAGDRVAKVSVDPELGREGFTFRLASGGQGSVHIDQVLDYCQDPWYFRDLLLYRLTLEARRRIDDAGTQSPRGHTPAQDVARAAVPPARPDKLPQVGGSGAVAAGRARLRRGPDRSGKDSVTTLPRAAGLKWEGWGRVKK